MDKKILIIGSELAVDNVIKAILYDEFLCNIEIFYPDDTTENYIKQYAPDLLIVTSGHLEHLIRKVKQNHYLKKLPIILLSGYYTNDDVLASASDDFLSKPVNIPLLLVKVSKYIG